VKTADGTAGSKDYVPLDKTLTFDPGQTSKLVIVAITGDVSDEDDETVHLDGSNIVNARIVDARGTGTITDDDCTGADPGAAGATVLANVVGDNGNKQIVRADSIDCVGEVDWFRFSLREESAGTDDLTARILMVPGVQPQGGG
jgi:hypothetical protein